MKTMCYKEIPKNILDSKRAGSLLRCYANIRKYVLNRVIFILITLLISASANANDTDNDPLFIVHFETGANWNSSLPPEEQTQFREHSMNLNRLRGEKVIVFGARYGDLGVIIIKAKSLNAAKSMIEADPGIQSGIFNFRIKSLNVFYPWEM